MRYIFSFVLFISYPEVWISTVKDIFGDFDIKLSKLKVRIQM